MGSEANKNRQISETVQDRAIVTMTN